MTKERLSAETLAGLREMAYTVAVKGKLLLQLLDEIEDGRRAGEPSAGHFEQPVEIWKRELLAAGWKEERHDLYRSPGGLLHRGPFKAWQVMKGHV